MLVFYSEIDCDPGPFEPNWLHHRIAMIYATREEGFMNTTMSSIHTYLRDVDKDPTPKPDPNPKGNAQFAYRHHIPYNRIMNAIKSQILTKSMTRFEILQWLIPPIDSKSYGPLPNTPGFITQQLNLKPDEFLKKFGSPLQTRRGWELWVNWAIWAICQYPENMWYGAGTGDNGGRSIDTPAPGVKHDAKLARIGNAAKLLKLNIPQLNITTDMGIEDKVFQWSTPWYQRESEMAKMSVNYVVDHRNPDDEDDGTQPMDTY